MALAESGESDSGVNNQPGNTFTHEASVFGTQPKPTAAPSNPKEKLAWAIEHGGHDGAEQLEAVRFLANLKPEADIRPEVVAVLKLAVFSRNTNVVEHALRGLSHWDTQDSFVATLIALLSHQGHGTRAKVFPWCGKLKDERLVEPVLERLGDFWDRKEASLALRAMGPAAERRVIRWLAHRDPNVRREVCSILSDIGTSNSLGPLRRLLADRFRIVQDAARNAIRAITVRENAKIGAA